MTVNDINIYILQNLTSKDLAIEGSNQRKPPIVMSIMTKKCETNVKITTTKK